MSYVEEFCEDIAIINHGDVVLAGHLDDIKDTYGRGRKTISADNYSPQELADICREKLSSYAAVERVAKKYVVLELKPRLICGRSLIFVNKQVLKFTSLEPMSHP